MVVRRRAGRFAGNRPADRRSRAEGPLKCMGPLLLSAADGQIHYGHDIHLGRCGGSATKPFCDGTHNRIQFVT